jgi:hypothetical protein
MANKKQVVIQSFVTHRVTANFRDEDGNAVRVGGVPKTVTVPALQESPKNILILTPDDFEAIRKDLDAYITLGQRKGMVIRDDIPSGFWDPSQRVADADAKRQMAEQQLLGAQSRIAELEAEIDSLKDKLREYGWKE